MCYEEAEIKVNKGNVIKVLKFEDYVAFIECEVKWIENEGVMLIKVPWRGS